MLWTVLLLVALTCARGAIAVSEKTSDQPSLSLHVFGEAMEALIVALSLVFLVVRPFFMQAFYIPSLSMAPTLRVNDHILVNKLSFRFGEPARNEVVVFRAPEAAVRGTSEPDEEQDFVKRVIGLPGDIVEVTGGETYVNGKHVEDGFCKEPTDYELPPQIVPAGHLFVMGDNRNHSNDSHAWGTLDRRRLIGKAVMIFWPLSRVGKIQ